MRFLKNLTKASAACVGYVALLTAAFGAHPGIGGVMLIFTGLPFLFILLSCFSAALYPTCLASLQP